MAFPAATLFKRLSTPFSGGPVWRGGPNDIVAVLYEDGVILEASKSAAEVIGAAGKLAGRSLYDFVARDDRAAVRAALTHAAERGIYAEPGRLIARFTLLRVRRAAAPAEIILRPIGRGRVSALIRECAGLRKGDAPRKRAGAGAATAPAPVDAAPGEELMADLAHEMKTPLNAIMGFADAMRAETFGPLGRDEASAKKYAEYAGHIYASGAHLTALIGAVQDYAKSQAGKYQIEKAPTRPAALAEEAAAMIRGAAEGAGLMLRVEIEPGLPEAMLDARAIRQVLVNLLSNAVKFTRDGEITLSVAQKAGALAFTVKDTGVGMNKVVLAKLGGRWSDTHSQGVRGAGGSGLGLSLAFELARLHGGALEIDSAPGEGTTARLSVPLADNAPVSAPGAPLDIQSQLDRVNAFRRERAGKAA